MIKAFENVLLCDAEDLMAEYIEEHEVWGNEVMVEEDEEYQIWQSLSYIHVPELNVNIHDCVYCNGYKNSETGEIDYEADFTGWFFRDADTDEIVYEEGYSTFGAAVCNGFGRNFCHLTCDIYIEEN